MTFSTAEDFLARARARLFPVDEPFEDGPRGDHDLSPSLKGMHPEQAQLAAVLIALRPTGDDYGVQLTLRPDTMAQHAGQVAFPGGRLDPLDGTLLDAALRESEEEIGLRRGQVEILGRSRGYLTGTGYLIAPFVGLIDRAFEPVPEPGEVADVFETPLSFLMNPANHERHTAFWKGRDREYFAMPHNGRYIWGATAGMLRALYERLYAEPQGATD